MDKTKYGYTSPESNKVSLWRNIELDSVYNMRYRQSVDKGPTIVWYDTSTNAADGQKQSPLLQLQFTSSPSLHQKIYRIVG